MKKPYTKVTEPSKKQRLAQMLDNMFPTYLYWDNGSGCTSKAVIRKQGVIVEVQS
jgi:hypothetical protein